MITDSRFVRNILVGCRSATVGDAHRHGRPPLSVLRVEGGWVVPEEFCVTQVRRFSAEARSPFCQPRRVCMSALGPSATCRDVRCRDCFRRMS
jgi:hypothetical protein